MGRILKKAEKIVGNSFGVKARLENYGAEHQLKPVPRRLSWRELIEELGDEAGQSEISLRHQVIRSMFEAAIEGEVQAANFLAKYGGGVTEFSEMSEDQLRAYISAKLGLDDPPS